MRDVCEVDRIRVNVEIFDSNYKTVKEVEISTEEEGYPETVRSLRQIYLDGESLRQELNTIAQKDIHK